MAEVAKDLKEKTGQVGEVKAIPADSSFQRLSSLNFPSDAVAAQLAMNFQETRSVPKHVTAAIERLNKKLQNDFHGKSRFSFALGEAIEEIVLKIDSKILVQGFFILPGSEDSEKEIYDLTAKIQNAEHDNKIKIFISKGDSIRLEVDGNFIPKDYDPQSYDRFRLRKIVDFIEKRKEAYPPVKIEKDSNLFICQEVLEELAKSRMDKKNLTIGAIDLSNSSHEIYSSIKYAETHGIVPRLVAIEKDYAEFDICQRRTFSDGRSGFYPVSERFSVKKAVIVDDQFYERRDQAIAKALANNQVKTLIEETAMQKINLTQWNLQAVDAQSMRQGDLARSQNLSFSLPRNEPYGLNPNYPSGEYGVCSGMCYTIAALAHNRIAPGTWASVEETAVRVILSHSASPIENTNKNRLLSYALPEKVRINNEFVPITDERVLREIALTANNLNLKKEYLNLNLAEKIQKSKEEAIRFHREIEKDPRGLVTSKEELKNILKKFAGLYSFAVMKFKYDSETNSRVLDSRGHAIILFLDKNDKIMVYDPNGDGKPEQATIKNTAGGGISLEYQIKLPDGQSKNEKWETYIFPLFNKPNDQLAEATELRSY